MLPEQWMPWLRTEKVGYQIPLSNLCKEEGKKEGEEKVVGAKGGTRREWRMREWRRRERRWRDGRRGRREGEREEGGRGE